MKAPYANGVEMSREARTAALAGTRQMIHADEFAALVGALIEAGAVPRPIMALALDSLADRLIRKARGEMEADFQIFPTEIFDRARELSAHAAMIRCSS